MIGGGVGVSGRVLLGRLAGLQAPSLPHHLGLTLFCAVAPCCHASASLTALACSRKLISSCAPSARQITGLLSVLRRMAAERAADAPKGLPSRVVCVWTARKAGEFGILDAALVQAATRVGRCGSGCGWPAVRQRQASGSNASAAAASGATAKTDQPDRPCHAALPSRRSAPGGLLDLRLHLTAAANAAASSDVELQPADSGAVKLDKSDRWVPWCAVPCCAVWRAALCCAALRCAVCCPCSTKVGQVAASSCRPCSAADPSLTEGPQTLSQPFRCRALPEALRRMPYLPPLAAAPPAAAASRAGCPPRAAGRAASRIAMHRRHPRGRRCCRRAPSAPPPSAGACSGASSTFGTRPA